MKKAILLSSLCLATLSSLFSQNQKINPSPVVAGAQADINYLASGYLSPLGDAIGAGLNNGWYHTAETHKLGRFALGFAPILIFVPDAKTSFAIQQNALQELQLVNPNQNITPTAFGEDEPGVQLEYKTNFGGALQTQRFNMPSGYGFQFMPLFTFGASVGLVYDTDITIRYLPQLGIPGLNDTRIDLYGFGVTHNFMQWVPVLDKLPFDASLFFGYTNLNFEQDVNDPNAPNGATLALSTRSYTGRLLVSKELLFLTFYGGLGYNGGESTVSLLGTYTYLNPSDLTNPIDQIKDPVNFTTNDFAGVTGNLGFRLKFLWVAYWAADYTFGSYDALTTNIGLSIDF